jgi:hypothetical protein
MFDQSLTEEVLMKEEGAQEEGDSCCCLGL